MSCLECGCEERVKSGIVHGKQHYCCRNCGYNYTTIYKRGKRDGLKRPALKLYLEGMSFRGIGRFLNVSNVSVLNWIRAFGEQVEATHAPQTVPKIVMIDEL